MLSHFSGVIAGLVPAIYVCSLKRGKKDVDARDKRGHDGGEVISISSERTQTSSAATPSMIL
jgi:hypothetical protein